MAYSQPSTFPPTQFSTTFPQQSFRLLELTPELVDIIEAQGRTSRKRKLWFKSSAPGVSTGRGSDETSQTLGEGAEKEGFLHLCTDEKIWAVKQVSTSNSLHVTRTMSVEEVQRTETGRRDGERDGDEDEDIAMTEGGQEVNGDDATGDPGMVATNGGITAISQVKNILELIEVKPDESHVESILRDMLPIFPDAETEDDKSLTSNPQVRFSTQDLFDNISSPTKTISSIMKRLFVFGRKSSSSELAEGQDLFPNMFIPSTNLLLKAWTQFTTQCTISGLNLDRDGGPKYRTLYEVLVEVAQSCIDASEAELILNVIMAILRRVADRDDCAGHEDPVFYVEANLDCRPFSDAVPQTGARVSLDPRVTRDLVGLWLLASLRPGSTSLSELRLDSSGRLTVEDFLEGWTKLIPDSWARECDVHTLVSSVERWELGRNEHGKEVLRSFSEQSGGPSDIQAELAKAQTRKKGKWHEKFGAQRSAAAKK